MSHSPFRIARAFAIATGLLAGISALPAQAEIRKELISCDAGLCPIFTPMLVAPAGWQIDEEASKANGIAVLVPEGSDFGSAEALIYGRAFHNADKTTIEARAEESRKRWMAEVPDANVERLEDIPVRNGRPFQLFHYSNPSTQQQAAEIVAFGEDVDKEGNLYGVQLVITAPSEALLQTHKQKLFTVIKTY